MPQSQTLYGTPLILSERPTCPACEIQMTLARTKPGRLKMDLHTFECVNCNHVHKELVAVEDIDYREALGWFIGQPKTPE